jgi:sarcosine oxidase subunit delta
MRIPCPCCGERDVSEFTYYGDATVTRPAMDETDIAVWNRFVYDRENPRGPHLEYWQHTGGCRSWFKLKRNVLTHDVGGAELVGPWARSSGEVGK